MRSLLVLLVLASAVSHAYEIKRDSTGAIVAWKKPLHFVVDEQLAQKLGTPGAPEAIRAALSTVAAAAPALVVDSVLGKAKDVGYDFEHPERSTSDVVVPAQWEFDENAVAITVVTLNTKTHEIIEADIAFNARHTDFAVVGPNAGVSRYDVQNAMTHELGHALGLAHNMGLAQSVMFPHSLPGEISKRTLAADDVDGLQFLYAAVPLTEAPPVAGCSATGTAPFALLAVGLMMVLRRSRKAIALVALLSFVGPVFASALSTEEAWTVESVRTTRPSSGTGILRSDVTVVRGGVVRTVTMHGGRLGDLEQVVEGVAVPAEGAVLALDEQGARPIAVGH